MTTSFEGRAARSVRPPPMNEPSGSARSLREDLLRMVHAQPLRTLDDVAHAFEELRNRGRLDLPGVGSGQTLERFMSFVELGATDLSLARLAEGHADAVAILKEAGREPFPKARYGVWAAEPPNARVTATRDGSNWILNGRKRFGSGASHLQRALITAKSSDGGRLFDVDLTTEGVRIATGTWPAIGMAHSDSLDVELVDVHLEAAASIGVPEFYLMRAGFWHGAVGVAACWLGGATGALRMLQQQFLDCPPDDHQAAHFGSIVASCAAMNAVLAQAAHEIDADPKDVTSTGRLRAAVARQVVEEGCQNVLVRCGRASGTGPMVFDEMHARRVADLPVYLRQHHAERDLAELGRLALQIDPKGTLWT
ncbi:MAG: acyl-CoA dehydrogenase [Polyangiaceae bacterium]